MKGNFLDLVASYTVTGRWSSLFCYLLAYCSYIYIYILNKKVSYFWKIWYSYYLVDFLCATRIRFLKWIRILQNEVDPDPLLCLDLYFSTNIIYIFLIFSFIYKYILRHMPTCSAGKTFVLHDKGQFRLNVTFAWLKNIILE